MTPSLQQAIKLLQMTRLELETALAQELVENPVLEESEDTAEEELPSLEELELEAAPVDAEAEHQQPLADLDFEAYFGDELGGRSEPATWEQHEAPPLEN